MRTTRTGEMILLSTMNEATEAKLGLPKTSQLNGLEELDKKGFIEFRQPLGAFLRKLRILSLDTKVSENSEHDWYRVSSLQDSPQFKELRSQGYKLTKKGQLANAAIVKAVSSLLSREAT